MRKQGVNTDGGLLGLNLVQGVFGFATFLSNGEDAEGGDGFERIVGSRMHHASTDGEVIPGVKERGR